MVDLNLLLGKQSPLSVGVYYIEWVGMYHSRWNGRAKVTVKIVKRSLWSNTGSSGTLETEKFHTAMLQLRNTPDPECCSSLAQVLYGRPLCDSLAFVNRPEKYTNLDYCSVWREAWWEKEAALRTLSHRTSESLASNARLLKPLQPGDKCYLQNQTDPKRWDRFATVLEPVGYDSSLKLTDLVALLDVTDSFSTSSNLYPLRFYHRSRVVISYHRYCLPNHMSSNHHQRHLSYHLRPLQRRTPHQQIDV